jgi:PPOX class probable F420-dependent enzyme
MDESKKIAEFLAEPHLADLVTLMADGAPHVAPVWYSWDGESYVVLAEPSTVKIRNIRGDARVAMSIASRQAPYSYVLVQGKATITETDTDALLFELAYRYMGKTEGHEYAVKTQQEETFVLITVTPDKTITFFDD